MWEGTENEDTGEITWRASHWCSADADSGNEGKAARLLLADAGRDMWASPEDARNAMEILDEVCAEMTVVAV